MSSASLTELESEPNSAVSAPCVSEVSEPVLGADVLETPAESLPQSPAGLEASLCEKCETPRVGKQGWCRRCGWYPRLGTFVELDPWDREDIPQPEPESKLDACKKLMPLWAWKLLAGSAIVLGLSFLVRQILPSHGGFRFWWTVSEMAIGFIVFCGAHLSCYLFAIMINDRLQILDILLKPLAIWITVMRELPETFWRVASGVWGVAAILGGLLVGGLADKDLLDWGGTPARYNLTKAIADRAQQLVADAETEKTLQESVEDFAGKAAERKEKERHQLDKPKLPVDCLILGYKPMGDRDFYHLIIATDLGGKLQVVGTVSDGIPSELRAHLNKRMRELPQPNPFVPCKLEGKWIRPGLVCRIKAKRWSNDNRLIDPVFDEMLVDIDVPQ